MRISKTLVNRQERDSAWLQRRKQSSNKKSRKLNRKLLEKLDAGQMVSSVIKDVTREAENRTLKDKHVRAEYLRIKKLRKQSNPRLFDKELARGLNHVNNEISIDNQDGIVEKGGVKTFKGSGSNTEHFRIASYRSKLWTDLADPVNIPSFSESTIVGL